MMSMICLPDRDQMRPRAVCYTAAMFIHRISVTGLSDRGAWPWRSLPTASAFAWFNPVRMNRSTACCPP